MKMSTAGWIGVIIGSIGGLIGMIVAIAASPVFGSIFALIFIVIFGSVFGTMFRGMAVKNKLMKTGVSATARILQVSDTGVTINNSPQIKLLLEVTPPSGMVYQVETKEIISRLSTSSFQVGNVLPVKVDLDNKNLVAIDYSGDSSSASSYSSSSMPSYNSNPTSVTTGPWAGMSAPDAEKKLLEIDAKNKDIAATGEAAKAIVTKYTWLGIYVGEDNQVAEIELEVLPYSGSPFKGKSIGVIMASSVPKYQPGAEIFVAYDRNDTSKVTITHS